MSISLRLHVSCAQSVQTACPFIRSYSDNGPLGGSFYNPGTGTLLHNEHQKQFQTSHAVNKSLRTTVIVDITNLSKINYGFCHHDTNALESCFNLPLSGQQYLCEVYPQMSSQRARRIVERLSTLTVIPKLIEQGKNPEPLPAPELLSTF
jgi:hypothetical protein